jgi:hypothetical protein
MNYFALITILLIGLLIPACPTIPTTDNPTNPEADSPFVLEEEVMPPLGCLQWQVKDGEKNADC